MVKSAVAVCVLLVALSCHSVASTPDGLFEIGHLFQQSFESDTDVGGRSSCASRRGVGECRPVGDDCDKEYLPIGCDVTVAGSCDRIKIGFPMKQVVVPFPCDEPFLAPPMIFAFIRGPDNSKMFTTTVVSKSESEFTANIQRTDDVENPMLTCEPIEICYFALPL